MTVLVLTAGIAAWALASFLVLVIFSRMVSRADEENEISSMRRVFFAPDAGTIEAPVRVRWLGADPGGFSTPLHS